jgi:FMN phosphatase YigB (HAD superfamily)
MIDALLLDLDNTLVDRDAALSAWLHDLLPAPALSSENLDALVACDRGGYGPKQLFFAKLGALTGLSAAIVRARFFRDFPRFTRLKPDAAALLSTFAGSTVVVTNGTGRLQRAKLAAAGLAHRIHHVVVSSEEGVRKPSATIFRTALTLAGCTAERALMVGDHPALDMAGARAAGIAGVFVRTRWFDAPPNTRAVQLLTEIVS